MTESKQGPASEKGKRHDLVEQILEQVDAEHGPGGRKALNTAIDSLLRICANAQSMVDRDERWRVRKGAKADEVIDMVFDSVRDCEHEFRRTREHAAPKKDDKSPHPLGAVAELLVAKTLATFAGQEAVQDISKWMRKAEKKMAERSQS